MSTSSVNSLSVLQPLTFTGVSAYSTDLQQVLSRAVSIAELPLQALQNQDTDILNKETALSGFTQPLTDLGNAVAALGSIASNDALGASSSDASTVSVTYAGATAPATYTVSNITSLATAASSTLTNSVPDTNQTPVSTAPDGAMALVVGGNTYSFTLTDNTLQGLEDQINSLNAGVNATILTTENGNYLSVSANNTGAGEIQLMDDVNGADTNILTTDSAGSDAQFDLNGIPIDRSSNYVNDTVPGMTFTLLNTTSDNENVTLTLAPDSSQLSSAIQTFVTAYNAAQQVVAGQVGQNAGPLSGDFLVRQVQSDLSALADYQGSGVVQNLSDLGITFDDSGTMSFDADTFNALSDSQLTSAFSFFGSSTTGFGALADSFTQLTDPVSGMITIQQQSYQQDDQDLQSQMTTLSDRINTMQSNLQLQLAAADSLIASLESQQQTLTASLQAVSLVDYGKQDESNGTS
jgi:flagellar hook-associated protein 2